MDKKEEVINQEFVFSFDVADHYCIGEKYIGCNIKQELSDGTLQDRVIEGGITGFFLDLVTDIFDVIGKHQNYNGFTIRENEFSLYFFINKSEHEKAMKDFKNWAFAKDLQSYITYKIYNPDEVQGMLTQAGMNEKDCNCNNCKVYDAADKLRDDYGLSAFESLQISIQMERNKILEVLTTAVCDISETIDIALLPDDYFEGDETKDK